MNTVRDAILLGTRGATETHAGLRSREQAEDLDGNIDVFGAIEKLGVPLLFRPLDKLLGACVRLSNFGTGIMVTTQRDLHMQRFTAAHELGHFVLEHDGSLDREIRLPGDTLNRDLQEVAADAFAAEFLMPRWLYIHQARRHGWNSQQLQDPLVVYQLSLRMAVSFEATCLGMVAQNVLDRTAADTVRGITPKKIKQRVLGTLKLQDPWADVWVLDERDQGARIAAGPNDLFVADLVEHGGSGYLWEAQSDLITVEDSSQTDDDSEVVGAPTSRRLVLQPPAPGIHQLRLVERRPWEKGGRALKSVELTVSAFGAEGVGLPRRVRESLAQPVLH